MLLRLLFLFCVVTTSTAFLVVGVGECPQIPPLPNFDLNKYLGTWYNYENFDAPFQLSLSCVTATYDFLSNGDISVLNAGYMDISAFGRIMHRERIDILGSARILNQSEPSKLFVGFGDQGFSFTDEPRANYQIVDTDYDNFSLVYSCTQLPYVPIKTEIAWILTRSKDNISPTKVEELKAILKDYGADIKNFKKVDQNVC